MNIIKNQIFYIVNVLIIRHLYKIIYKLKIEKYKFIHD